MTLVGGSQRVCEWCSAPLNANQLVACGSSHRLKRWRWLNDIPVSPYGGVEQPPAGSVLLNGSGGLGAFERHENGSQSGLQVSFPKALRILTEDLAPFVEPGRVEAALLRALPERQLARLTEGGRS